MLKPEIGYVVVSRKPPEERVKDNILIPTTVKESPNVGTVVAVGSGDKCVVGDRILFKLEKVVDFVESNVPYVVIPIENIVAKIEEE